jgi:hypothetical protein
MKRKKIIIFIIIFITLGIFGYLIINNFGKAKMASLQVDSNMDLIVYVDGIVVGRTPYIGTYNPKLVTLKVGSYETQVNLEGGIKTIVKRDFNKDGTQSSGLVVSFVKNDSSDATLAVVTDPGGALVKIDNILHGVTPININLTSGIHKLDLTANGFNESDLSLNLINGYKLIAIIDLLPTLSKQTEKPETQTINQVMVQILSTPTGFLRVRSEPNSTSDQIGEVHPGEKYPFVKKDDKTGWFDIQLTATQSGWITNTYAATVSGQLKN